ncbi:Hypothetical predicted protein [Lecanosticta acicola]|uniref:Uncharacterized protein n=1 Tax=Lecanosticta acicola TaxID=111012 RepID=A0AAI9E8G3_9PEZI|nr:Hypothetical predicted protein [Lecanosticta acicola]
MATTSAAERVFRTTELLEKILLETIEKHDVAGVKSVLYSQRVSKQFRATIRGSSKLRKILGFEGGLPLCTCDASCGWFLNCYNKIFHSHKVIRYGRIAFDIGTSNDYSAVVFTYFGARWNTEDIKGSWREIVIIPAGKQVKAIHLHMFIMPSRVGAVVDAKETVKCDVKGPATIGKLLDQAKGCSLTSTDDGLLRESSAD